MLNLDFLFGHFGPKGVLKQQEKKIEILIKKLQFMNSVPQEYSKCGFFSDLTECYFSWFFGSF